MVEKVGISKRKIKAVETKNKIYKSAEQLFKRYDYENVSVDSIVELAGVSKGAFYVHFATKDSLIAALISDIVNKVDLSYKSYLEAFPSNSESSEILISLVGKIADIITCTIGYDNIKTVYKVQITKTINTDAIMSYNRELYKIFSDLINKGVQQGEFKTELPVDVLAKHFIMALRGLTYEWCIRHPDFDLKEQAVIHFKILLSGIKKH
ncbi:MAG: TetR family transcriptional regulator [Clostridiales bacterium GWC2_40_7]|nr:MAG: TetR family transcriptional regulator [Clostridiales bacterium GWC2_40_7]